MKTKEQIGVIGVDAGLVMVGDPCYSLHADKLPADFGKDWPDFCDKLEGKDCIQLDYDLGQAGLAVVAGGFGGDGVYPVFVEKDDTGRVIRLIVEFA